LVDKIKDELDIDIKELIERVSPMGAGPGGLAIPYAMIKGRDEEW